MKKYLAPIVIFISIVLIVVIFAAVYVLFKYTDMGLAGGTNNTNSNSSSRFLNWFGLGSKMQSATNTTTTLPAINQTPAPDYSNPNLPFAYVDAQNRFSINLPDAPVNPNASLKTKETTFIVDTSYMYQLNPNTEIPGTRFTIPTSIATGTNLGSDTFLSIEEYPTTSTEDKTKATSCGADIFLDGNHAASLKNETIRGAQITYSVATSSNAGAGNRYEETVFALKNKNGQCFAIRYLIHYSVFENYPAGSIRQFNMNEIVDYFDQMRRTVVLYN